MKWGKTTTRILERRQAIVTSWQYQSNIFEENDIREEKINLINYACHENQILAYMKIASAKSWSAKGASGSPDTFHKC